MLDFLTAMFRVLSMYVSFLFTLQIVPGVSFGTLILFVTILGLIVKAFWVRG